MLAVRYLEPRGRGYAVQCLLVDRLNGNAPGLTACAPSVSLAGLVDYYSHDRGEDWRAAARYVLSSTQHGDGIAFVPFYAREPFEYCERNALERPENLDRKPIEGRPRLWLVIREPDAVRNAEEIAQLRVRLRQYYRLVGQREFHNVKVEVCAPPCQVESVSGARLRPDSDIGLRMKQSVSVSSSTEVTKASGH